MAMDQVQVVMAKRKPNWSESELLALSDVVASNISVIRGQFGPGLTIRDKNTCWAEVAKSVNAVSTSCIARTVAECKKKWQDVQGTTKKKEAARRANARATGGGPPPVSDLRPWESAVLMSLTKTQLEGVDGGVDTLEQMGTSTSILPANFSFVEPSTCIPEAVIEGATVPIEDVVLDQETSTSSECSIQTAGTSKGKTRKHTMTNDQDLQVKFLRLEEEKYSSLQEYRQQKLELLQRNVEANENVARYLQSFFCNIELNK